MSFASTTFAGFTNTATAQGDEALGRSALSIAIGLLNNAVWCAIAFSFSSFWIGLLVWCIGAFVTGLLLVLLNYYVQGAVAPERFESAGRVIGSALGGVRSFFSRR